jgi:dipeptide/tripeptide permease
VILRFSNSGGVFWVGPALLGALLIAVGVLIILVPQLLAYAVAAMFIAVGVGLLGASLSWRGGVTYRRLDGRFPEDAD